MSTLLIHSIQALLKYNKLQSPKVFLNLLMNNHLKDFPIFHKEVKGYYCIFLTLFIPFFVFGLLLLICFLVLFVVLKELGLLVWIFHFENYTILFDSQCLFWDWFFYLLHGEQFFF
jgi:hypothetical protein